MIVFGSFGKHVGISLGSFCDYFGIVRETCWDQFGDCVGIIVFVVSGPFGNHFGMCLGSFGTYFWA